VIRTAATLGRSVARAAELRPARRLDGVLQVEAGGIWTLGGERERGIWNLKEKLVWLTPNPPLARTASRGSSAHVILSSDCTAKTAASEIRASNSEATSNNLHGPQRGPGPPIRGALRPEPGHLEAEQRASELAGRPQQLLSLSPDVRSERGLLKPSKRHADRPLGQTGCSTWSQETSWHSLCHLRFTCKLALFESRRADSNRFPAHYEFACVHTSPYWCVRESRLFMGFSTIWRSRFVHCVLVCISPVAVRLQ
jgi:hypothetical protein